ncbi:glutathione S-transferase N-terminal domain-containing protein [Photobacterium makurazakiensis]|uniref:glutaredoxin family protein n=1 Tax=Photobacterium makurazakiensis TaxID=2910234 RepID=UPI003D0B419D
MKPKAGTKRLASKPEKLMLYHFVGCPYCSIAREPIDRLGINVELRDTMKNPQYRSELITERGRGTVPVLRIINSNGEETWMPESSDIARYLETNFNI